MGINYFVLFLHMKNKLKKFGLWKFISSHFMGIDTAYIE